MSQYLLVVVEGWSAVRDKWHRNDPLPVQENEPHAERPGASACDPQLTLVVAEMAPPIRNVAPPLQSLHHLWSESHVRADGLPALILLHIEGEGFRIKAVCSFAEYPLTHLARESHREHALVGQSLLNTQRRFSQY